MRTPHRSSESHIGAALSIRVVLADDHELVRGGIRALLESLPNVEVIAEARDGRELLALLEHQQPDVVITDIMMPMVDGLAATAQIKERHPDLPVLVLSMYDTVDFVRRAVASGASGYLMKCCPREELGRALGSIVQTGSYFSSMIAKKLLEAPPRTAFDELTERQVEVLVLIAQGMSAKEIAYELGLSPKTVDVHRARIMERLDVKDIAGLTRYAVRMGLVTA